MRQEVGRGRRGQAPFREDDEVRLVASYVEARMRPQCGVHVWAKMKRKSTQNNEARRAKLTRVGVVRQCNDYDALVVWSGTRACDTVSVRALERTTP